MYRVIVSVALAVGAITGPAAFAQTDDAIPTPAEVPPADYDAASYVDSRGCAYARAAVNGVVTWVPQLGADRKPLCGLAPSLPPPPPVPTTEEPGTEAQGAEATGAEPAADAAAPESDGQPAEAAASEAPTPPVTKPTARAAAPRQAKPAVRQKAATPSVVVPLPPTAIVKRDGLWRQIELPAAAQGGKTSTSGIYVQVGAYGRTANAEVARNRLRAAGLPVAGATARKGADPLYLVLTGPFADPTAAQDALRRARAAGFTDAFIF